MTSWPEIEAVIEAAPRAGQMPQARAAELLAAGEAILEGWLGAQGESPTASEREGFRLLALQRQGAAGDPSFNACRESCRELVYHHNMIVADETSEVTQRALKLMPFVARHLYLFVTGKLTTQGLGDFCCAAKPVRAADTV